ncbi:ABATE domain-containing protein [Myxococcus sp. K15C18031901]|uniref:CGNR zinc finger domain-containing protein n=1 Tax=Myxococcus dinghuensis TaxID=2906761 RepID=UPI0020A79E9C|nr:CGNR zinc finger domain-containing protein [Myxococcus dinghuensis]MCP3103565.1 ABATE domain-containing protein [Myxococcus dinghuensis]
MPVRHRAASPQSPAPKGELRDGFKFGAGRLALDLAATLPGRFTSPADQLQTTNDLSRWLVAAGLTEQPQQASPEELVAARELREGIYRLAVARTRGESFSARDRAIVNRWAAEPPPAPQLGPRGLMWAGAGVRGQLSAVAREAAELLGGPRSERVRACPQDGCGTVFLDTSTAGKRRFCGKTACANKTARKQAPKAPPAPQRKRTR